MEEIERARKAQQEHEQKHDVQLEITTVCKCGHKEYDHYPAGKGCVAYALKQPATGPAVFCKCSRFRLRAT